MTNTSWDSLHGYDYNADRYVDSEGISQKVLDINQEYSNECSGNVGLGRKENSLYTFHLPHIFEAGQHKVFWKAKHKTMVVYLNKYVNEIQNVWRVLLIPDERKQL